jgi:alpha-beta hydrolase superfamily lysophospholipase
VTATGPVAEAVEDEFRGAGGLRLFFRRFQTPGVEPRRLVVLVHGFADHSGRYGDLVQHLAGRGAVVYAYDQRGSGLSEGQRGHVMDYRELLDDLARFVDLAEQREPGLERVLYAHSTGAIAGFDYALEHPDKLDRIILSAPALILKVRPPGWKVAVGKGLAGIAPRVSLKAGFDTRHVSRDVDHVLRTMKDPLVSQAISTRFYREVYLRAAPAALARIEALRVPFLYLHGDADQLVSSDVADEFRRRAQVPGEVHVYPGAYHETFADVNREEVFADIDAWLERPPGPS